MTKASFAPLAACRERSRKSRVTAIVGRSLSESGQPSQMDSCLSGSTVCKEGVKGRAIMSSCMLNTGETRVDMRYRSWDLDIWMGSDAGRQDVAEEA